MNVLFDDRLATVLRQRATGEAGLRTQMRQLLDLLGRARAGAQGDQSLLAAAWLRLEALAEAIPASERARMIREPGWRLSNPDLVAHLAEQESEVAAAALSRASLSAEEWTALIPDLPVRARGFLRLRRDLPVDVEALLARLGVHDRGLPAPDPAPEASPQAAPPSPALAAPGARPDPPPLRVVSPAASPSPPPAPTAASGTEARTRSREESGRSEISALVERIAQYQR
ncbi:MAG: sensor histidine kinase, partial [Erythrobacter cryptus]